MTRTKSCTQIRDYFQKNLSRVHLTITDAHVNVRFRDCAVSKSMVFIFSLLLVFVNSVVSYQTSLAEDQLTATGPTIAAGGDSVCVIVHDGTVSCWGPNLYGSANVPTGMPRVTQITAGRAHACALTEQGKVYCWGSSFHPEVRAVPNDIGQVKQISAGNDFTCALYLAGSVRCWGRPIFGQLDVPGSLGPAKQVSAGYSHACVVLETAFVRCWGSNSDRQSEVPSGIGQVKQIAAGDKGTCVINLEWDVKCWGDQSPWWKPNGSTLVPQNLGKVSQLEMGWFTCAIDAQELVRCWGSDAGQFVVRDRTSQISIGDKLVSLENSGRVESRGGNGVGWEVPVGLGQVLGAVPALRTTSQPMLKGFPYFAGELEAHTGVWDEGTSFTYQWFRNEDYIDYATTDSYTPNLEDVGQRLLVKVTGSKPGYKSVTRQSESILVQLCELPESQKPRISGSIEAAGLGDTLQASGVVCGEALDVSYRWLRDNKNISKATNSTYKIQYEDLGADLTLRVSAAISGETLGSWVSEAVEVKYFKMAGMPCPNLKAEETSIPLDKNLILKAPKGRTFPGQVLNSDLGAWPAKTKVCSFWLVGSNQPQRSSTSSYLIKTSDVGKHVVGVEVGTDVSGDSTVRLTKPVKVALAEFIRVEVPLINNTWFVSNWKYYFLPNQRLTATDTKWPYPNVNYKYTWRLDYKVVSRSLSYTPSTRDVGGDLWFEVCASKFGYKSRCMDTLPQRVMKSAPKPPTPVRPTPSQCAKYRLDIAKKQAELKSLKPFDWESWRPWNSQTALAYFLNRGDVGGAAGVSRLIQGISVTSQLLSRCR